jgi:serine phosphatase RsbU (regulator of sigma subunit)
MNRPADETGGDYYDWHTLPDGRLAVVVADVTGHGIGPALLMAVCRAYARASVPIVSECGEFFRQLNEFLYPDLRGDRFITFALALLDERGMVQLCSAGHGPTLLYRASTGRVERFGADGIPLGVDAKVAYGPARPLDLQSGDVLLMLTDGFFEWRRSADGEAFGIDRLCEELVRCSRDGAASILDRLDKRVCEFVGGSKQSDDMTAVVVRRL